MVSSVPEQVSLGTLTQYVPLLAGQSLLKTCSISLHDLPGEAALVPIRGSNLQPMQGMVLLFTYYNGTLSSCYIYPSSSVDNLLLSSSFGIALVPDALEHRYSNLPLHRLEYLWLEHHTLQKKPVMCWGGVSKHCAVHVAVSVILKT